MTKQFAVVGNPVAHSLSPQIHAAFAKQCGLDLEYQRLLLEPQTFADGLQDFFTRGGAGLNVTLPFKQAACEWVTELDSAATLARAVNTIAPIGQSQYKGFNTDGVGLVQDLRGNLGLALAGQRILVIGAGGAAQGVLAPLLANLPVRLTLANRTKSTAETVVASLRSQLPQALSAPLQSVGLSELDGRHDLIINATSASVSGKGDIVPSASLRGAFCYDMMYGPNTAFCDFARNSAPDLRGLADGLGMLVEQAAAAFRIWHGPQPALNPAAVLTQLRHQGLGLVAGSA